VSYRLHTAYEETRTVVAAAGELDAYAAPELRAALLSVAGSAVVVCDLSAVEFLDSTALGVVVGGFRRAREASREFAVILPRGTARRIFELTSLDQILPTLES
jgi:anti-sigma B factor antagonist